MARQISVTIGSISGFPLSADLVDPVGVTDALSVVKDIARTISEPVGVVDTVSAPGVGFGLTPFGTGPFGL